MQVFIYLCVVNFGLTKSAKRQGAKMDVMFVILEKKNFFYKNHLYKMNMNLTYFYITELEIQ